ncbi:MAG: response regulator [Candidatus Obscuribacterales bacterium]|nr:response regulator [Candidatus Obscuribacterales bacterium]
MAVTRAILIVDDDNYFREWLCEILESRGLIVKQARSAAEADHIIKRIEPILAIVDYRLPGMDGMSWISKVREAGRKFSIVFLSSSWCDQATFSRLRNLLQVALILRKPIEPDLFMHQLETLLPFQYGLFSEDGAEASFHLPSSNLGPKVTTKEEQEKAAKSFVKSLLERVSDRIPLEETIAEAKIGYLDELTGDWSELTRLVQELKNDTTNGILLIQAIELAHRLRGTAGSVGFKQTGVQAAKLENVLRQFDHCDTLQEVLWTEVFRALAEGQQAISVDLESGEVKKDGSGAIKKFLVLGDREIYKVAFQDIVGQYLPEIVITDNMSSAEARMKAGLYVGAILDLSLVSPQRVLKFARDIRMLPDYSSLPIAFVASPDYQGDQAAIFYAGGAQLLSAEPTTGDLIDTVKSFVLQNIEHKPRVLTVDDDNLLTRFLKVILEREGMVAEMLNEPINIIESLEEFEPDVVLLDVIMPGLSGFDVCRVIREHERFKDTSVLFLTSRTDADGRAMAFKAGADDFLSKPVVPQELLARIKAQLAGKQAKDEYRFLDPICGFTRIRFLEKLLYCLEERPPEVPICLCVILLDDFAGINTVHGLYAAQNALDALGQLIKSRFRPEDLRGRWYEEGFAISFNGHQKEAIAEAIGLLQEEFSSYGFSSQTQGNFKATFTAGIADTVSDGTTIEAIVDAAQKRLIQAREGARVGVIAAR